MRIDIVSCVPRLLDSFFEHSIVKRARESGKVTLVIHDLREYSLDKHHRLDDYPFGGGAGMVMSPEPIFRCFEHLQSKYAYDQRIYMTPDGKPLVQSTANALSLCSGLLILCGHYKGVDERAREALIDMEISIGDFVVSGGEIPAAMLTDAVIRLIPGAISDETSALSDSFQDGLLAPPVYTRPAIFRDQAVPEVLLSGHQANIDDWRFEASVERTKLRRPDLYEAFIKAQPLPKKRKKS